jgi:hypothetical protein
MVDRTYVDAPCPGTATNYVVVVGTPEQCLYGIGNPKNTGGCLFTIHAMDSGGAVIDGAGLSLDVGESANWYNPPQGTAQIVVVCVDSCTGAARLEYDMPNA